VTLACVFVASSLLLYNAGIVNVTLSENETKSQSIWSFLLPQKVEALLYVTIAIAMLAIINYRALVELALNGSGVSDLSNLVFSDNVTIAVYRAYEGLGSLSVLLLWMFVGCIVYAFGWFFRSITISVRSDIENTESTAANPVTSSYAHSAVSKYSALFASLIAILGYVFLLLNALLPLFSRWTFAWYGSAGSSWLILPLAIFGLAISLYVLKLLLRITSYTLRTISPK